MTDAEYIEYARKNSKAVKYKLGETVMVDPNIRPCLIGASVTPTMCQKAGKTFEIIAKRLNVYYLADIACGWQDYMLVDAQEPVNVKDILSMLQGERI